MSTLETLTNKLAPLTEITGVSSEQSTLVRRTDVYGNNYAAVPVELLQANIYIKNSDGTVRKIFCCRKNTCKYEYY